MLRLPFCLNTSKRTPTVPGFTLLFLCVALYGCGGGSGGGRSDTGSQPAYNSSGQALLGPVVGAAVDLYTLDSTTAPVCTTTTTDSDVLEEAGLIRFEDGCLAEDGPYIVVVSGGNDIDADDDGIIDTAPTAMNGALHALITAEQIRGQDWKVNILTDVIYSRVRYMLALGMGQDEVLARLAPLATELLSDDINGDEAVDYRDVLAWSPRRTDIRLKISTDEAKDLTDSIHAGTSREYLALHQLGRKGAVYPTELSSPVFSAEGDRAYLCTPDALEVVDIGRPQNITRVAHFPNLQFSDPYGLGLSACEATTDGYVYYFAVLGSSLGILATENSSTANLTLVARDSLSVVAGARVIDDRLYVSTYQISVPDRGYLEIYDIGNRLEPRLLSTTELNGYAVDIATGPTGLLYLPTANGELVLLDVTNVSAPDIVGRFAFTGAATSVAVAGDRAYLSLASTDGNRRTLRAELLTLDVSVPADIRLIGEALPFDSWLGSLQAAESSLLGFKVDEEIGYAIVQFRLSDSGAPEPVGVLPGSDIGYVVSDFRLHNGTIFVTGSGGFHALPLPTQVADPGLLGIEPTQGKAYGLAIKDTTAYLAVRGAGVYVVDIADPARPERISLLDGDDEQNTAFLALNGNTALLLGQMNPPGTRLMDITDPLSVAQIGNIPMDYPYGARAEGGVVQDNVAYLACDVRGLIIADISDPARPQTLAEFPLPEGRGEYSGIGISGDYVLALDEGSGMDIIDVSNPGRPVRVGSYTSALGGPDDNWTPANVEVSGGFAYITQVDFLFSPGSFDVEVIGGLEIVDISNPRSPTFVSTVTTSGKSLSVALSDNLVFVRDTAGAINIVDVTDPVQPQLVHSIRVPDELAAIAVDENLIYVTGANGLYIYKRPRFDGLP